MLRIFVAAILMCAAVSASQARIVGNGTTIQGMSMQGVSMQGVQMQGMQLQGMQMQGLSLQGAAQGTGSAVLVAVELPR